MKIYRKGMINLEIKQIKKELKEIVRSLEGARKLQNKIYDYNSSSKVDKVAQKQTKNVSEQIESAESSIKNLIKNMEEL